MIFLQSGWLGAVMNLVKTWKCSHFDNGLLSSLSWWNGFKLCQVLLLLFLESQHHFHLISTELQPTVINSDSCGCQMSGETGDGCVCFWWKWEVELNVISLHCRSCYITTSPSSSCTEIMSKKVSDLRKPHRGLCNWEHLTKWRMASSNPYRDLWEKWMKSPYVLC